MAKSIVVVDAYDDSTGRYVTVEVVDSAQPGKVLAHVPFRYEAGTPVADIKADIKENLKAMLVNATGKTTIPNVIGTTL